MATSHEQWQIFRDNELEICRETYPDQLIVPLFAELRKEWSNITDQATYVQTLQELKHSLRDAVWLSVQARIRRKGVESL